MIGRPITVKPPGSGGAQSDLLQPGLEADRRPGRSRDGRDLGGRDGAPGRQAARDRERRRGGGDLRRGRPDADRERRLRLGVHGRRRNGTTIRPPLSVGGVPADSLDLSPDGRLLAAASFDGSVFVWDAKTGEPYGSPLTVDTSPVNEVAFSPDGRTLVSAHHAFGGRLEHGRGAGDRRAARRADDLTTDVSFSPDGKRLVAGQFDGGAVVYDTATRRQALRIDVDSIVTAVAFAPDGKLVAVGTIDGRVRFFDPRAGRPSAARSTWGNAAVWQVAFSPDGRLLAVAVDPNGGGDGFYGQQRQGEVQLWDVGSRSPRRARQIVPGAGSVLAVAFNADGTLLATGSGAARPVGRGDPGTSRQPDEGVGRRCPERRVRSERPARRRRRSDRPGARVARGRSAAGLSAPHRPHRPVTGAAFDAAVRFSRRRACIGGTRLWDPATGLGYGDELVGSPRPGSARASSIDLPFLGLRNAFSPDGKLLAIAGVEHARDAVGRRPRGLARACLRDRRPKPEPRGVEALSAGGDALSRDVLGVAHRLTRRSAASALPNGQKPFLLAQPTSACRRGSSPRTRDRHPGG